MNLEGIETLHVLSNANKHVLSELNLEGIETFRNAPKQYIQCSIWIEPWRNWNCFAADKKEVATEIWIEPWRNWNYKSKIGINLSFKIWIEPWRNWNAISDALNQKSENIWIEPWRNWNLMQLLSKWKKIQSELNLEGIETFFNFSPLRC